MSGAGPRELDEIDAEKTGCRPAFIQIATVMERFLKEQAIRKHFRSAAGYEDSLVGYINYLRDKKEISASDAVFADSVRKCRNVVVHDDFEPSASQVLKARARVASLVKRYATTAETMMSSSVAFVAPGDTISKATALMRQNGFSQIPVLESGANWGTVTESGVVALLERGYDHEFFQVTRIDEEKAFTVKLPIIDSKSTYPQVRKKLLRHTAVLVTDTRGVVVGIIAKSDLLAKAASAEVVQDEGA